MPIASATRTPARGSASDTGRQETPRELPTAGIVGGPLERGRAQRLQEMVGMLTRTSPFGLELGRQRSGVSLRRNVRLSAGWRKLKRDDPSAS